MVRSESNYEMVGGPALLAAWPVNKTCTSLYSESERKTRLHISDISAVMQRKKNPPLLTPIRTFRLTNNN